MIDDKEGEEPRVHIKRSWQLAFTDRDTKLWMSCSWVLIPSDGTREKGFARLAR